MLIGACLVMVQYHVSFTWLASGSNTRTASGLPYAEPADSIPVREELLHAAVDRLRLDEIISASISQKLVRDLMVQLGRELLAVGACGEVSVPTAADTSLSQVPLTSHTAPRLYIITPTYRRPEQIAELTRMAQTLMHVQNLHWLVIEDAQNKTQLVSDLLQRTGISHDHLIGKSECKQCLHVNLGITQKIPLLKTVINLEICCKNPLSMKHLRAKTLSEKYPSTFLCKDSP